MPYDPNITFQDAEQARAAKLSVGKQRRIPSSVGLIESAANAKTFYIFNVGPWPQSINTGSTGWYQVPGCPKDKPYVVAQRTVKAFVTELTIKDEFEYNHLVSDGEKFAGEVVGDGRGRDPGQSLRRYGLFYSHNQTPTKEEIAEAKKMLHATCAEIVSEARDWYAIDRKTFSQVVSKARHFTAAEVLNLNDEPWMIEQTPAQRTKCPVCMAMNDDGAMKCMKCGEIIDAVAYRKFKDRQDEILTAPKK